MRWVHWLSRQDTALTRTEDLLISQLYISKQSINRYGYVGVNIFDVNIIVHSGELSIVGQVGLGR